MTLGTSPPLAFGFASPWLLGGLALGAIPVVIHLLYKRRFRETSWAAMRFLLEAARKHSRRLRMEQWLLLAVRTAILILLAIALARPYVETIGGQVPITVPTHRIVIVDASLSMGYRSAQFSRFERAANIARQVVEGSGQGDAFNLLRIADSLPRAIIRQPAFERQQVIEEIDRLQLTEQRGDLLPSLEEAEQLLDLAPEISRKEIYVLSDFQRTTWRPAGSTLQDRISEQLDSLAENASLMLIDVAEGKAPNIAITELTAAKSFVTVGDTVRLRAEAANFGDTMLSGQAVELYVDGKLSATRRLELPAGARAYAEFASTPVEGGEHRFEVRLPGDGLEVDDHRWLAMPVKGELNVLLVNGRPAGRGAEEATHYLETVLAPSTSDSRWEGVIRPHVISDSELVATDLNRYDCVFLCDVALITAREAEILRRFAENGGGIVFGLGAQVRPDSYNQLLYRDGEGILPAKLGNRVGNARSPETAYEFNADLLDHPIVSAFEGNPGTGLETALTFEYFQLTVPPQRPADVVLRFTSGDPAIVAAPLGRGHVVVVATSLDTRWSIWPVQRSFPPIMHEMVKFLVTGRWTERQRLVGEPIDIDIPAGASTGTVMVQRPDGKQQSVVGSATGEAANIAYTDTTESGIYEVTATGPRERSKLYAVNVDPRESDLDKLGQRELDDEILDGISYRYRTDWEGFDRRNDAIRPQRGGISRWLLAVAFCLLFVEQTMAWRFGRGLTLLYLLIAGMGTLLAGLWSVWAGAGVLVLFAVGAAAVWRAAGRVTGIGS